MPALPAMIGGGRNKAVGGATGSGGSSGRAGANRGGFCDPHEAQLALAHQRGEQFDLKRCGALDTVQTMDLQHGNPRFQPAVILCHRSRHIEPMLWCLSVA